MSIKRFDKGQVIFREGEAGTSLFELRSGSVGVYIRYGTPEEQLLTEIHGKRVFGEMAAIMLAPRSATAVALEDGTETEEVGQEEFKTYFEQQPGKLLDLMQALSRRTRELTADYNEVCEAARRLETAPKQSKLFGRLRMHLAVGRSAKKFSEQESGEAIRIWREEIGADFKSADGFQKGQVIFRKGETGDCMYDIRRGSVGIYLNYGTPGEKLLRVLRVGSFFGEMGLIDREPRSADAVALEDDTLLLLVRDVDLPMMFSRRKDRIYDLLNQLADRLRNLTDQYVDACRSLAVMYDKKEGN
ncbi:MAG: cyclic nucleotide-binding domain-containing protein [Oscillospiraceae bacterium]|nr:cyclic nucleotide-binding domain-containing protein [Oscillospiraceae bacterium]